MGIVGGRRRAQWKKLKRRMKRMKKEKHWYQAEYGEIRDAGKQVGTSVYMTQSAVTAIDGFWGVPGVTIASARSFEMSDNLTLTLTTRDISTLMAIQRHASGMHMTDPSTGQVSDKIRPITASTEGVFSNPQQDEYVIMRNHSKLLTWKRSIEYELMNDTKFQIEVTVYYFKAKRDVWLEELASTYSQAADIDVLVSKPTWDRAQGDAVGNYYSQNVTSLPTPIGTFTDGLAPTVQYSYPTSHQSLLHSPYRSPVFTKYFKIYNQRTYTMDPGTIIRFKQEDNDPFQYDMRQINTTNRKVIDGYLRHTKGVLIKGRGQILSGSSVDNTNVVSTAPVKMTLRSVHRLRYNVQNLETSNSYWDLNNHYKFRRSGRSENLDQFDAVQDTSMGNVVP